MSLRRSLFSVKNLSAWSPAIRFRAANSVRSLNLSETAGLRLTSYDH